MNCGDSDGTGSDPPTHWLPTAVLLVNQGIRLPRAGAGVLTERVGLAVGPRDPYCLRHTEASGLL